MYGVYPPSHNCIGQRPTVYRRHVVDLVHGRAWRRYTFLLRSDTLSLMALRSGPYRVFGTCYGYGRARQGRQQPS
jgi:hypothetical protein